MLLLSIWVAGLDVHVFGGAVHKVYCVCLS